MSNAVLSCLVVALLGCRPVMADDPRSGTASASVADPVDDLYAGIATDLSACLASCRVESVGRSQSTLDQEPVSAATKARRAQVSAKLEGKCRTKCLRDHGEGLRCSACKRRIAERECVYGKGLTCAWYVADTNWSLPCCRHDSSLGATGEAIDGTPGVPCPSSNVCP